MKHAFLIMAYNEPEILNFICFLKLYHENNCLFCAH